ncbi:MAG: hypothetical protein ACREJN_09885 [Nitrospiraceae bacterium]
MPRSTLQNQGDSLQNDVSEPPEMGLSGTGAMPQLLLPSPDSGMIVFSSAARILHMNGSARALMALFGTSHELWPQMAPESMPSILTEFCGDVLVQLRHRVEAQDWAQFEMRRICYMVTPAILLTGFGVPNATNREIRVILTLTPLSSMPCAAENSPHPGLPAAIRPSVSNTIS